MSAPDDTRAFMVMAPGSSGEEIGKRERGHEQFVVRKDTGSLPELESTPGRKNDYGNYSLMKPVTILIADDDDGHALLVERNLRRTGLKNPVVRFRDGQEVLDFFGDPESTVRFNPTLPYLLLLDIRMPKVDGVEVLRRLKTDPALRNIPVIMLTTTDDPREIRRCHEFGCNNYVVKPVAFDQFSAAIQQVGLFLNLVQVPPVQPNA